MCRKRFKQVVYDSCEDPNGMHKQIFFFDNEWEEHSTFDDFAKLIMWYYIDAVKRYNRNPYKKEQPPWHPFNLCPIDKRLPDEKYEIHISKEPCPKCKDVDTPGAWTHCRPRGPDLSCAIAHARRFQRSSPLLALFLVIFMLTNLISLVRVYARWKKPQIYEAHV